MSDMASRMLADPACHGRGTSATMTANMQHFFGDWFFYGGPGPA
jgi:hypothetical protein